MISLIRQNQESTVVDEIAEEVLEMQHNIVYSKFLPLYCDREGYTHCKLTESMKHCGFDSIIRDRLNERETLKEKEQLSFDALNF